MNPNANKPGWIFFSKTVQYSCSDENPIFPNITKSCFIWNGCTVRSILTYTCPVWINIAEQYLIGGRGQRVSIDLWISNMFWIISIIIICSNSYFVSYRGSSLEILIQIVFWNLCDGILWHCILIRFIVVFEIFFFNFLLLRYLLLPFFDKSIYEYTPFKQD